MRKIPAFTVILLSLTICFAADIDHSEPQRMFDITGLMNSCGWDLGISNYAGIGPNLLIPSGGTTDHLYIGGLWVGAKKYRRNENGVQLYWLAQNPSADSSGTVAFDAPGWTPYLKPVVDTLTSVGFDGDNNLYELLPAYNPLLANYPAIADLYNIFNTQDKVLKSIQSYPSPLPFEYPDPQGTYCFSIPQNVTGNEPAFETASAYYYDKCPFNSPFQRDWGASSSNNLHYPLGLAIEQKSYAWTLQSLQKVTVLKYNIVNMSPVDTLYDISIAYYLDCDIGPVSLGSQAATDDQSGYSMGQGYEFAFSKDGDGDGGQSPYYVGSKFYLPGLNLNKSCYTWSVGNGPEDDDPLNLNLGYSPTANQKYWLMTGRNPYPYQPTRFVNLRGGPTGDVADYYQPNLSDTRFIYSYFGNLPTPANPNPANRLHLAPGQSMVAYMVLFAEPTLPEMKLKSQQIETLINNNLNAGNPTGQITLPYINQISQTQPGSVSVSWFNYNEPYMYRLCHKQVNQADWDIDLMEGFYNNWQAWGFTDQQTYLFKVEAYFGTYPDFTIVSSQQVSFTINDASPVEDEAIVLNPVINYPNPVRGTQGTTFRFVPAPKGDINLTIYNVKGQPVRTLVRISGSSEGNIFWDGLDDNDMPVSDGIYLYRLQNGNRTTVNKMLLLK